MTATNTNLLNNFSGLGLFDSRKKSPETTETKLIQKIFKRNHFDKGNTMGQERPMFFPCEKKRQPKKLYNVFQ